MTLDPTMLLYTYISRFSVTPHYIKSGRVAATNAVPRPFLIAVSTSRTNGPRSLSQAKVGTHSALLKGSHTRAYTAKQGPSGRGRYHYPRHVLHVHEHPRAGYQNGKLCRFWTLAGALSKNAESLRNSDALMRVAVPRRRGPAGLRRPTPPAERTVLAPISPRVQLCLRRPAFPLSAFIPGA